MNALFVARKDLKHSLRLPQVWVWMFVMPMLLSFVVGSLMESMAGRIERLAFYAAPNSGFLAEELLRRLDDAGYQMARIDDPSKLEHYALSLRVPDAFTQSMLARRSAQVELTTTADYAMAGWEKFRVSRAVAGIAGDLAILEHRGKPRDAASLSALAAEPRTIELHHESAGRAQKLILGFRQSVPGFMVMFTLLVALTSGSILITERRLGVLRRLASTPVSRASILCGKLASRVAIGLLQVAGAMLVGKWCFGVDWGGIVNIASVVTLMAAYTTFCAALALLLASVTRSESQCHAAGVIASNLLAALGGCWWPVEVTPKWTQHVALVLPTGWTMNGMHLLISYDAGAASILPHVAGLLMLAGVTTWLAVRRFRFN